MMNGTGRMAGLCYGMTNWKEYTGITYPYVVGTVSNSLMVHPGGAKAPRTVAVQAHRPTQNRL